MPVARTGQLVPLGKDERLTQVVKAAALFLMTYIALGIGTPLGAGESGGGFIRDERMRIIAYF